MKQSLTNATGCFFCLVFLPVTCSISAGTGQFSSSAVPDACPTAHETARRIMEDFLTGASWADERKEVGLAGLSSSDIRQLKDPEDTEICQQLRTNLGGNEEEIANVFYQAESFFFIIGVAKQDSTPGDLNWYGETVVVFETSSLEHRGTFIR